METKTLNPEAQNNKTWRRSWMDGPAAAGVVLDGGPRSGGCMEGAAEKGVAAQGGAESLSSDGGGAGVALKGDSPTINSASSGRRVLPTPLSPPVLPAPSTPARARLSP